MINKRPEVLLVLTSLLVKPNGPGAFCLAGFGRSSQIKQKMSVPNMQRKANLCPLAGTKSSAIYLDEDERDAQNKVSSKSMEAIGINGAGIPMQTDQIAKWPCGDDLDQRMMKFAIPCIANFAIAPLIGAVDLFWVNRMKNPLAVAGQAASNQIFNSLFWLSSFLPSGKNFISNKLFFHSHTTLPLYFILLVDV